MRSMQWQLGIVGTISAFAFRQRETKKNLCRDEELHEIIQNSSYEEHVEYEEEEDNETKMYKWRRKLMTRLEQVYFRGKTIQQKVLLLYVQPIRICPSNSVMQWRSKPLVTIGKHVTLFLLSQVCKMMQKLFLQFQKHCNFRSMVEEMCIESNKEAKPLYISSNGKQKAGRI